MTPKEKAFHLHFSFIRDVIADKEKAKKCALIAVDETLRALHFNVWTNVEEIKYWNEVKKEMEKL